MSFTTASISNPGGRSGNEDFTGYLEAGNAGCWIVADGLGFHGGGAVASRVAVETVLASFRSNPSVSAEAVSEHLHRAHGAIRSGQTSPELSQMKSTAVVLVANQNAAVCGHIGDSRLYHFRASHIAHQTQDHSVPGALAASGDIGFQQIRFHEDRNRLLRSLGGESENSPTIETRNLTQGDAFLLCSDGFWEYVNELEMEVDCAKSSTPAEWMSFMTARLLQRAQQENDNYTGMGVFFQSPSAPPPSLPPPRSKAGPAGKGANHLTIGAIVLLSFSLLVFAGLAMWAKLHRGPLGHAQNIVTQTVPSQANAGPGPSQTSATEFGPLTSQVDDLQLESEIQNADPGGTIKLESKTYIVHSPPPFAPKTISVIGAGEDRTCLVVEGDFKRVFAPGSTFDKLSLISKNEVDVPKFSGDFAQFRHIPKQRCVDAKSPSGAKP